MLFLVILHYKIRERPPKPRPRARLENLSFFWPDPVECSCLFLVLFLWGSYIFLFLNKQHRFRNYIEHFLKRNLFRNTLFNIQHL
jgi:hypothetical protein